MTIQSSQEVDLLIHGGVVITMDEKRRIYDPGFVAIQGGKITGAGSPTDCPYVGKERLEASDMVVLPGLVNAHDHLDQSVYRSCLDGSPGSRSHLLDLARGLTRERARTAATLSLLELLHYGVTTTQENHWTHYHLDSTDGICEAIRQSGMRAIVSRGMSELEEYIPIGLSSSWPVITR